MSPNKFVDPEIVSSHFHFKEGDVVADFGAGSGFFLKSLSKAVGPAGRVYACDIQKVLVDKIGDFIRASGFGNVQTLWCDFEEPNGIQLANGALDGGILVNTLFMFEKKEVAIKEFRRVIRTGGLLCVIDWQRTYGGFGPHQNSLFLKEDAVPLFEANGYILEQEFPAGEYHYGLTFRKV